MTTVMTRIVVDKSTDHAKQHFDLFFLPQNQRQRKCFLFKARAEKGIAWHIDASGVVWALVDNGKLANQIARLVLSNCGKHSFIQTLFTPVNSILLDLISATFSEGNLLMTSFSLAGRPRPKTSCTNTEKHWNLIMYHHTCTTGLIWYSATNRRDQLQLRHWMCFTIVLMKVCGNTVRDLVLHESQGISREWQV